MIRLSPTRPPVYTITIAAFTLLLTTVAQADPGLIAVFTDGKHTAGRVVPTPNFTLADNESVHSQIASKFDVAYSGMLKISRGGEYTISGDARIVVDGKDVAGETLKLSPGDHSLKITYSRQAGPARLQLRWKSDFFIDEPIPPAAFGHEKAGDALTRQWTQIEQGRLLYENLSCGACHGAGGWNLSVRSGPDLSDVGSRVTADWLYAWLKDPRHYRKTAVMPSLLSSDDEVRDVTAYLSKLVTSPSAEAKSVANPKRIEAGKEIFDRVGCNKCHGEKGHSLASVGGKYNSSRVLARYLADPLHVDPSGRMPQMFDPKTQAAEAELVAEFLYHTMTKKADAPKSPDGGDVQRGRKLVESRGCISCHAVKDGEKPLPDGSSAPQFTSRTGETGSQPAKATPQSVVPFDPKKGCLAEAPGKGTPNYELSTEARSSLRAFMVSVAEHPVVAAAPVETFYRRVNQFNCTACHSLNDQNNNPAQEITEDGKIVSIERPPSLTGAGDKLRANWIKRVLIDKKRTRPWMKMRMPHFGSELSQLPALFPASSGSPLEDKSPPPNLDLAAEGLKTIGIQRGKVACIACHDYRSINRQAEGVVSAPDMSEIGETLRSDWFRRWLHNPPRITPGTSMPQFFPDLKADAREKKIDELWAALVHQARLPLPEGLIVKRTQGTKVLVGDDPVVFRVATKVTSDLKIDRAINVGLPSGINFTFDAATARLCGVWTGEFINAAPAWNGRGGKPVDVVAKSLSVLPQHFPLRTGSASAKPTVRFLGYYLVQKYPVFRYSVDGIEVHERIEVTDSELVRHYAIEATEKPIFFNDEEERVYSSPNEPFKDGVLSIPAGKQLKFEVRRPLTQKPIEIKDSLKWIAVAGAGAPKSNNGAYTTVVFENKLDHRVKLFWVGYDGNLKPYGAIDAGATYLQSTYSNNTWLIADENDNPLGYFTATSKIARAVIPSQK